MNLLHLLLCLLLLILLLLLLLLLLGIHYEAYPKSHALTPAQLLVLNDPAPRQFPSLVNCCTIDWFKAWPKDALEAVASKFLKEIDLEDAVRERLMLICQQFHSSVSDASERFLAEQGRFNYVTPTSYLELLSTFNTLLTNKRAEAGRLLRTNTR